MSCLSNIRKIEHNISFKTICMLINAYKNKEHIKLQYEYICRRHKFNMNDLIELFWGLKFIGWMIFILRKHKIDKCYLFLRETTLKLMRINENVYFNFISKDNLFDIKVSGISWKGGSSHKLLFITWRDDWSLRV